MRKTLLARSSPTRVTDEVSMIDLPTDGSLPDGALNDDHLGTLDAARGAVHPISNGSRAVIGGRREECLRRADSAPPGVASGRTGVHAIAVIRFRARNRLYRPFRTLTSPRSGHRLKPGVRSRSAGGATKLRRTISPAASFFPVEIRLLCT